jgi:hypothetical protein
MDGEAKPAENGARPGAQQMQQRSAPSRGTLPHIDLPLPTTVRGTNGSGARFELETALDSLSSAELALRLEQPITVGAGVFAVVWLTTGEREPSTPGVALRGVVVSSTAQPGGGWSVWLRLQRHRFLYLRAV